MVARPERSFLLWGTATTKRNSGEIGHCVAVSGGRLYDGDAEKSVVMTRLNTAASIAELVFVWEVVRK